MAGSGPAPNPNSRRQSGNQSHTWVDLPASYEGAVPAWPLSTQSARESEVWADVWLKPQASFWARTGASHDVAFYVRCFVQGEAGDLDSVKEARMWSDRLGINPAAMLKNRWRVRADEVGEQRAAKKPAAKRRLAVADGAVAGS